MDKKSSGISPIMVRYVSSWCGFHVVVMPQTALQSVFSYTYQMSTFLTLRTSHAGMPALHKLPYGVALRYTGGTLCQRQASHAGIPALFSKADWHQNNRLIEIQTRQQLTNKTQQIFVKKFCIWTPSSQRMS